MKSLFISFFIAVIFYIFSSCSLSNESTEKKNQSEDVVSFSENDSAKDVNRVSNQNRNIEVSDDFTEFTPVRIGHHVNTASHEYLPVFDSESKTLFFTGMDRTGFFDFKLDFTKQSSSGGEDIFSAELKDGLWLDARPLTKLNTNAHEAITDYFGNNHFMACANYPENLGPKGSTPGTETTDLFELIRDGNNWQIKHFPEPVNSIFTEADGVMLNEGNALIFVSDRPGHVGEYHKKGWGWRENTWGNTDVYVAIQKDGLWQAPVSLGNVINSSGAERSPWLSPDGLTLYVSSNGYEPEKSDLDVYAFKRKSTSDWVNWTGPFKLKNFCSDKDDWGFKYYTGTGIFLSQARDLGFKPTQGGKDGDGGIRETNFRTGYTVSGAQVAALKTDQGTDILWFLPKDQPFLTLRDVLFATNSDVIKKEFHPLLERLSDWCLQNEMRTLIIVGHCDNTGSDELNEKLSIQRAESIKNYLISLGIKNKIEVSGKGSREPLNSNRTEKDKQLNRRVECFFR